MMYFPSGELTSMQRNLARLVGLGRFFGITEMSSVSSSSSFFLLGRSRSAVKNSDLVAGEALLEQPDS